MSKDITSKQADALLLQSAQLKKRLNVLDTANMCPSYLEALNSKSKWRALNFRICDQLPHHKAVLKQSLGPSKPSKRSLCGPGLGV